MPDSANEVRVTLDRNAALQFLRGQREGKLAVQKAVRAALATEPQQDQESSGVGEGREAVNRAWEGSGRSALDELFEAVDPRDGSMPDYSAASHLASHAWAEVKRLRAGSWGARLASMLNEIVWAEAKPCPNFSEGEPASCDCVRCRALTVYTEWEDRDQPATPTQREQPQCEAQDIKLVEALPAWGVSKDREGVHWLTCHGRPILNLDPDFKQAAGLSEQPDCQPPEHVGAGDWPELHVALEDGKVAEITWGDETRPPGSRRYVPAPDGEGERS